MLNTFQNWRTRRKLPPELQEFFDQVQKDPQLQQDYQQRVQARKQSPQEALQDMMQYKNMQSYQSYKNPTEPSGATPKMRYKGDLRKGQYNAKDMTGRVLNPEEIN